MSHEIWNQSYVGRRPAWHGLGISDVNLDPLEALRTMGVYRVVKRPIFIDLGNGRQIQDESRVALVRSGRDEPHVLGYCGPNYPIIQPEDFAARLRNTYQGAVETAMILQAGARLVYCVGMGVHNVKGDEHAMYSFVEMPYTGKDAVQIGIAPVRVVCANTLHLAVSQATVIVRVTHTRNYEDRLHRALETAFGKAQRNVSEIIEALEMLSMGYANDESFEKYLEEVFPLDRKKGDKHKRRVRMLRNRARAIFQGATGTITPKIAGTPLAAFNAVSEVIEHESIGPNANPERHGTSVLVGAAKERIRHAHRIAVKVFA